MQDVMQMDILEFLRNSIIVIVIVIIAVVAGGVALLVMAAQQIRDLEIPEDADFFETMQMIPITIPIALDLLDLALDVFSAPLSWILLDMLGLGALKMITLVESLIPFTGPIPTMTIAWGISRTMIKDRQSPFRDRLRQHQMQNRSGIPRLTGSGGSTGSRADRYRNLALPPGERAGRAGDEIVVGDRSVRSSRSSRGAGGGRRFGGLSPVEGDDAIEGEYYEESDQEERRYLRGSRSSRVDDDYAASEDWDEEEL